MKTFESGCLCLTLLVCGWATAAWPQQAPPPSQEATSVPATTPEQDAPPQQATPPAQTAPPDQAAPAQQPAAQQPAAQQPPATPVAPTGQTSTTVPLPPPMPKVPDVRMPGETGLWVGFTGWFPTAYVDMNKGNAATWTYNTRVKMQGTPRFAQGFDVGLALGLHNVLRFSYFTERSAGDETPTIQTYLWGMLYPNGTLLSTNYRLQDFKLSFDYLSWPYPVESRRFRLKTLYQVQYIGVRTSFDNPTLPLYDSNGNPLLDAQGNPISYATLGSKWYVTPTLGIGTQYWKSKRLRLETATSGFAIPRHSATADGEASVNWRFGHWELKGGVKAFYFKTSPTGDYYMRGKILSGIAGIRWYSD